MANTFAYVDTYKLSTDPDDTDAIRKAIADAAVKPGKIVGFSGREYKVSGTIDLPSGVHLLGVGRYDKGVPATVLRRTANVPLLRTLGVSFKVSGDAGRIKDVRIEGLHIDGDDFGADLIQFIATGHVYMDHCFVHASAGRLLLARELMDSRITNCDWEWGGTADGTIPMIEINSGGDYEYSNHIHWVGCRFESYPGTAIAITGDNTNKIFFDRCKIEMLDTARPSVTIANAVLVRFRDTQITQAGPTVASAMLRATDCRFITGDLILEHARWATQGSYLSSYISLDGCEGTALTFIAMDGQTQIATSAYVQLVNCQYTDIRGTLDRGASITYQLWA